VSAGLLVADLSASLPADGGAGVGLPAPIVAAAGFVDASGALPVPAVIERPGIGCPEGFAAPGSGGGPPDFGAWTLALRFAGSSSFGRSRRRFGGLSAGGRGGGGLAAAGAGFRAGVVEAFFGGDFES
jgi:hypothetical protein